MDVQTSKDMTPVMRVLHVDDEPMICDVTRLCLERGGRFKVDVVHTAADALSQLKDASYSCIISDYEMPNMNGIELLKEIRSFDDDIPFILFSGRGRETVVIEAINTGADFYIQKGGDAKSLFAELNHKVDYAISKRNARIALRRRDAILEAVSLVATLFLGGEPFRRSLAESITLFGLATEVDKVFVFLYEPASEGTHQYRSICGWSRLGNCTVPDDSSFPADSLFAEEERIIRGEMVIGSVPEQSDVPFDFLRAQEIRSFAAFPVIANREVRGLICFCDCLTIREWAPIETDALQAASSIIGSALHQEEMRSELIQGKEEQASMYSLMRQLCDTVPDMLWAKDHVGNYIFVNKATSDRILGCIDTETAIGRREADFLVPIHKPLISEGEQMQVSGKQSENPPIEQYEETRVIHGTPCHFDIRSVPFFDQYGAHIGTVTVGRDVTADKERERAYNLERKKYAGIFHHVHIGLITCLPCGEVTEVNRRAAELLGIGCKEMYGINLHSLGGLGETGLLRDFSAAQALKVPIHGRSRYIDTKGVTRTLYYGVQPHLDETSRVMEILVTIDEHYQDGNPESFSSEQ